MSIAAHHTSGHDHSHDHKGTPLVALSLAFGITVVIFLAELIGGLVSGSLALLSDAMHMLSDSTALIIALIATLLGRRAASDHATFGHKRVEVLAALVNAVAVTAVTVWIVISAISRLGHSHEIDTSMMFVVAIIGLVANAASALILSRHQKDNMNVRGAFLHVIADLLGSVMVIIAAIVIHFTGFTPADTIASFLIVALVLPRALKLLSESMNIILERVPKHVEVEQIRRELEAIDQVAHVHDLHIWTIDGQELLGTCHVVVAEYDRGETLHAVEDVFSAHGINHSTVQVELVGHVQREQVCR